MVGFVVSMAVRKLGERIPEVDGLRGLAILLVFCLHYISDSAGGAFGSFLYRFQQIFRMGWSGVDLFFILSGFLIGGILMEVRDSQNYFRTFYLRRLHRIIPVYFLWISLYPFAAYIFSHHPATKLAVDGHLLSRLPLYYLFIQSFAYLPPGTLGWFWLAVTWSLAVEEQFYLLAAPLVRWFTPRGFLIGLLGTFLGCPLLRWGIYARWPEHRILNYVLMPCRADSLAMGMLAAWLWRSDAVRSWLGRHRKSLYVAVALLAPGLLVFTKWFPDPSTLFAALVEYQWLALFYGCLLLVVLVDPYNWFAGAMRSRVLRELGSLSYCIYLVHFPILAMCHAALLHSARISIGTLPGLAVTLLAAAVTYGLAKLSWTFFELPLIKRGHAYRYEPALSTISPNLHLEPSSEPQPTTP